MLGRMARISTYLNFAGQTEEAFRFYAQAFQTEISGPIQRMGDVPPWPGMPAMSDAEKAMVMHIEVPILAGHVLMGTDAVPSMGQTVKFGNNVHINLEPDTRAETDRLFAALSAGGEVKMPLAEMFWGGYFGHVVDRFGVHWMFNCAAK